MSDPQPTQPETHSEIAVETLVILRAAHELIDKLYDRPTEASVDVSTSTQSLLLTIRDTARSLRDRISDIKNQIGFI